MTESTDAELIALLGDRQFSSIGAVREALRRWGTPPAVAGEPVAWLSTDSIGERYLCFTKPNDSDPARPLVFGDTTPQPTQAQSGAVPLTDEEIVLHAKAVGGLFDDLAIYYQSDDIVKMGRAIEAAHGIGIKGGQHGAE